MKVQAAIAHSLQNGLLGAASLLVPRRGRIEWLREWRAELWHVRFTEARAPIDARSREEQKMFQFCLGAFQDAWCLRRLDTDRGAGHGAFSGSAFQCVLVFAAILAVSYGLSRLLPGVQAETHPSQYRINPDLIMIQNGFASDASLATISAERYRGWKAGKQRYFDGFAFYRIAHDRVAARGLESRSWRVAHASMNLFWLLGLPMMTSDALAGKTGIVLSERAWRRIFGGRRDAIGQVVEVNHQSVEVVGVVPAGEWRLPGNMDAWVLEPDSSNKGIGYVLAHLTALGKAEMSSARVPITSWNAEDEEEDFYGVSCADRTQGPWGLFQFSILLAFLALPAITSVSLGESNFCSHRPSWTNRLSRWTFFGSKVALLLPIVYYGSMDLAYWHATTYSLTAQYVQLLSSFSMCLFGMRWILLDQRQRCPVCLRRVTHPAHVGLAGRTFLAWNGTELMCTGGHTLLHVPALPTSWFSTQRWLYLDTSWKFLFVDPGEA